MLGKDWKIVKNSGGRNIRIYTRTCNWCGSYYEGRGAKFCSKKCACLWGRKTKDYTRAHFPKGLDNPNGRGISQSKKDNLSAKMKEKWKNGSFTSKTFRPRESSLEKIVREEMEDLGILFKRNKWINIKGYRPKEYDFYIPQLNLLLEVDGYYWHSRPENVQNDSYKDELARVAGYRLLRIPEKHVKSEYLKILFQREYEEFPAAKFL